MSPRFIYLFLCQIAFGAIDYLQNCAQHLPACFEYNDGCNDCSCNMTSGLQSCTERACLVQGTPYCHIDQCDRGYWLAFNTFQGNGYPTCDSRLILAPTLLQDNSKCACPASYPYYEPGVGCVNANYCDSTIKSRRDQYRFRLPSARNSRCPYPYQLCTSNLDCPSNLICNIPKSNYETCIPLSARMDDNCNPNTNCGRCQPDCMGTGYGYCTTPPAPNSPVPSTPAPITPMPITAIPPRITPAPVATGPELPIIPLPPPPINCAAVLCLAPQCSGCKARNIQIDTIPCGSSPCCGCGATFSINGRDVTSQCTQPEIACRCAAPTVDETYCCLGEQFNSLCELNCGTCYDINLDCTKGPCNPNPNPIPNPIPIPIRITPVPTPETIPVPEPEPLPCPSGIPQWPIPGAPCAFTGICSYGEETCCGETHASYKCSCEAGTTQCFNTDACFGAAIRGCGPDPIPIPIPIAPAPITPSPVAVQPIPEPVACRECRNPITGECDIIFSCPRFWEFLCRIRTCDAFPEASCVVNTCGGCGTYYEDAQGNAYSSEMCAGQVPPPPRLTPSPTTPDPIVILPQPIPSPQCPGCRNPITGECSFFAPCPNANYCQRPFPAPLINVPTTEAVCDLYPDAVCKFTGCGGCTEYFEDPRGNIYLADECKAQTPVPEPSPKCEIGGCSSQLCGYGASQLISTCEMRCEYGCLRFRACEINTAGNCGWSTISGQETDYQNCMDACNSPPIPIRITPAPVTSSPTVPDIIRLTPAPITTTTTCPSTQCVNPITGKCGFMVPCPAVNYCRRPFPGPINGEPTLPKICAASPNALCKFTGCGGCTEYFEDDQGNILTIAECNVAAPPPPPRQCETGGCSSQLCAMGASMLDSSCEVRCEFKCLQFQTCGFDINGKCGWQINPGQEIDYETCRTECKNQGTVGIPAPITPAPVIPINPWTPLPTTPAPVTQAPISPAPVTAAPVTLAPVVTAPSPITPVPITAAPISPAPITLAPVTFAPVTSKPTTSAPITAAPVTSAPVPIAPIDPFNPCEVGGCGDAICGFGAGNLDTPCNFNCNYGCTRRYQTCKLDTIGRCGWITDIGEEVNFENCMARCNANPLRL